MIMGKPNMTFETKTVIFAAGTYITTAPDGHAVEILTDDVETAKKAYYNEFKHPMPWTYIYKKPDITRKYTEKQTDIEKLMLESTKFNED